jgi:hypothetical protein
LKHISEDTNQPSQGPEKQEDGMGKRAGGILIACLILVFASITIAAAASAPGTITPDKFKDQKPVLEKKRIKLPDLKVSGVHVHPVEGGYQIIGEYFISECMTGSFWITVKINGVVFAESEMPLANMPYIARTCNDHEGGLYYLSMSYVASEVFHPSSPSVIELKLDSKTHILESNEFNNTATWTMQ